MEVAIKCNDVDFIRADPLPKPDWVRILPLLGHSSAQYVLENDNLEVFGPLFGKSFIQDNQISGKIYCAGDLASIFKSVEFHSRPIPNYQVHCLLVLKL